MKQPPALDDKLIRNCIRMLKWAPLLLLANGYWMISNEQIFNNVFEFISRKSDPMKSNHFFFFETPGHYLPILIMAFAHIALVIIMVVASEWMKRTGFTLGQVDIEIDEDLPSFFKSVSLG